MKIYIYRATNNEMNQEDILVYRNFEDAQRQFQADFVGYNSCEWFEIENEYHADIDDREWFMADDDHVEEIMESYRNITFQPNEDWEILYGFINGVQGEPIGARVPYKNGEAWWLIEEAELL